MGGEYIPMILSLQWIIVFEETSEISAEFGFFPVSTKMKAHWACASIFHRLKSYIVSFLYLFALFVMAIFCCWGKTEPNLELMETSVEQPSRWLWRGFTGLSVSIDKYLWRIYHVFTMWKRRTSSCKNPWRVYRLLLIFSACGFSVIIKFQPATCNLQNMPDSKKLLTESDSWIT